MKIDLVFFSEDVNELNWKHGDCYHISASPKEINACVNNNLKKSSADYCLFWDERYRLPEASVISKLVEQPGDIWHVGLRLGMNELPKVIDFVAPTWMLNCDPAPDIEATSWRVSLKACLVRTDVFRKTRSLCPEFESFEAASLEWGHRCIHSGVIMRNSPELLPSDSQAPPVQISFVDELRFSYYRFGRKWAAWTLVRAILSRYVSFGLALQSWKQISKTHQSVASLSFRPNIEMNPSPLSHPLHKNQEDYQVSVLIPTLNRYPYLHTLLCQMRNQTVPPLEIIVIDQTQPGIRQENFYTEFQDIPLRVLYQDFAGQCSSRNAGLKIAKGKYILFLDDDEEVDSSLIQAHLSNLNYYDADVSCGVAVVPEESNLPTAPTLARISDVFPTGNTLVYRSVLEKSGLFDLAYERNAVEDADLGMRIYLNGNLMILNPDIRVLHHHAPQGGLRAHKARVITYSSSRQSITQRRLASITEIYLARRYFSQTQVREMLILRIIGTFSLRGNLLKKILKIILGTLLLPDTVFRLISANRQAVKLLQRYPQIPNL